MGYRVTDKMLEAQIRALNETLGHEEDSALVLDVAYGGVMLNQQVKGGGQKHVFPYRVTRKEMEMMLLAFSVGIEEARR